jgi:uncharacterized protein (DUF4415 family)
MALLFDRIDHLGNRGPAGIVPVQKEAPALCIARQAVHYRAMGRDDSRDRSRDWRDMPKMRREPDARAAAERAFRAVTTKPVEAPPRAAPAPLPGAKETVTLRLDRDVLDFFQHDGPGWQDRINAALRKVTGR